MTWWAWVLMFVAFLAGGLLVLVGMLATRVVRGEPLGLRPAPLPKPQVLSPKAAKETWSAMQRRAKERSYGDIHLDEESAP